MPFGRPTHSRGLTRAQMVSARKPSPLPAAPRPLFALGLEGSANKLGCGVVRHDPDGHVEILSNVRHTYITPPGEGFLPGDTARHHRDWIMDVVGRAMAAAAIDWAMLDCICFTQGALDRAISELRWQDRAWAHLYRRSLSSRGHCRCYTANLSSASIIALGVRRLNA